MDPLTIAALAAAAGSFVMSLGPKGKHERTGGPSDEEVARAASAARNEYRTGRTRGAREGARAAMQAGAGRVARSGGGRSGAFGSVAGNVGAVLGRDEGEINAGAAGEAERVRSSLLAQRHYAYDPSTSEQGSVLLGKIAGPLGTAAALRGAVGTGAPTTQGALRLGEMGSRPPLAAMDGRGARIAEPASLAPEDFAEQGPPMPSHFGEDAFVGPPSPFRDDAFVGPPPRFDPVEDPRDYLEPTFGSRRRRQGVLAGRY